MTKINGISTSTQLLGIIGNPIEHSMSPAIHNRAFRELGLDYVYLAFRVEDVESAIRAVRAMENFKGLSVTIPHKMAVIKFLDQLDQVDVSIGSVNTIIKEGNIIKGLGTDGPGARKALSDAGVALKNKQILLLGSGGAARAIAFDLAYNANPSMISLLGVASEELNILASDIRKQTNTLIHHSILDEYSIASEMEKADVIIHATPIGMHPQTNTSLIPKNLFRDRQIVMDIVYNPIKTRLIKDAEECGLLTIPGIEMFVNQAVLQFEAWTRVSAPVEVMRQTVLEQLTK